MKTDPMCAQKSDLPKKNILVVDDDTAFLSQVEIGLSSYPGLSVMSAENGLLAISKLAESSVDLVVTDIRMPQMDGLALVSHITRHYPKLPVIIVTAHGTEANEHQLAEMGILSYIKKPIDINILAERIFDLSVGVSSGYVHGISVASFLQLLHADNKSCCLRITAQDRVGFLHFVNGDIWDAKVDDLIGLPAALEIISWEDDLTIDIQNVVRLKERTVDMDVTFLVMEAFRRKDEADNGPSKPEEAMSALSLLPERGSISPDVFLLQKHECCGNPGKPIDVVLSSKQKFMLLECLIRLGDVSGYMASAVLTHTGEVLATHSVNVKDDIDLMAKTVNSMFSMLGERSRAIGLKEWEETVFRSSDGIILFRCPAHSSMAHVHVTAVIQNSLGEGLLRIRLKRVLDEVVSLLADMLP